MKLKNIAILLRQGKFVCLFNGRDCQWLGDGFAAYPIYGLPRLNVENVRTLIDVSIDSWEGYHASEKDLPFSEDDNDASDIQLSPLGVKIVYRGMEAVPFIGNSMIFFVQPKYIKPFENSKENYFYFARKGTDGRYIVAIKEGFILRGLVMPCSIICDEFLSAIKNIYGLSYDEMSRKKHDEKNRIEMQQFMDFSTEGAANEI